MATRTVRLDDESEQILAEIRRATGLSVSAALKRGLVAAQAAIAAETVVEPYAVYAALDLGPGGYARSDARHAKEALRGILVHKHRRRATPRNAVAGARSGRGR